MSEEINFIPDMGVVEFLPFGALSQQQNWGIDFCKIQEAWRQTTGAGIRVAVLDTGISNHPDLVWSPDDAANCSMDPNYIDEVSGHGTHCAGIVCAKNNEFGVVGVAPDAILIPIKVLNNNGGGSFQSIANGIKKAIELKADIISMSLGCPTMPDFNTGVHDAIKEAVSKGIIVLAAAGNDKGPTNYPARFEEVIAVSAIDQNGNYAPFASGDESVDSVGPGVDIYSTYLNQGYAKMSGTSQATPFIAGLCALALSYTRANPSMPQINNYVDMLRVLDLLSDDSYYVNSGGTKKWGFGAPKIVNIDWRQV
jgi:subtilisin family serine protease